MGDADPETAKLNSPNSLRALYGLSVEQNAVMGSPDAELAEIQIASLFASSPLFSSADLPAEDANPTGSVRSVSSAVPAWLADPAIRDRAQPFRRVQILRTPTSK